MKQRHPIAGLSKWVDRDDWLEHVKDSVIEHVEMACSDAAINVDRLNEVVGDEISGSAWSAAFEDFLTRDLDDGRNVVEEYLKRRGWKESPGSRAYLQALRHASMSLYLVEEVAAGGTVTLRDELRESPPVQVRERELTTRLRVGQCIACRVFEVRGHWRMGSFYLDFDEVATAELKDRLEKLSQAARAAAPQVLKDLGEAGDDALTDLLDDFDILLTSAAFLFTDAWLRRVLDVTTDDELPQLVAPTGEPYEVATATWALATAADLAPVRDILESLPQLRESDEEEESETAWRFVDTEAGTPVRQGPRAPDEPVIFDPRDEDGAAILGTVELVGNELRLSGNTLSRLERGRELLEAALGDRLGPCQVERRSLEEAMQAVRSIIGPQE